VSLAALFDGERHEAYLRAAINDIIEFLEICDEHGPDRADRVIADLD
jgi:hypothetical protein